MRLFGSILIIIFAHKGFSQEIHGLWEVSKVTVGQEIMTPVAKWFWINKDQSYSSGNGWLQNDVGSWNLDDGYFSTKSTYQPRDSFGQFKIQLTDTTMTWEREEEGEQVVVYIRRSHGIPVAPADLLTGLWKPEKDGKESLFIPWDRIYVTRDLEGNKLTCYWHINGHRPEVTFLPHDKGAHEQWKVEVDTKKLTMIGLSDSNMNQIKTFFRATRF